MAVGEELAIEDWETTDDGALARDIFRDGRVACSADEVFVRMQYVALSKGLTALPARYLQLSMTRDQARRLADALYQAMDAMDRDG